MPIIKSHRELAEFIAGKRILHMNSMGKDSIICLEWLTKFAHPAHITSVYYKFLAEHPGDERYWKYLAKRYPSVQFVVRPNTIEMNQIQAGVFQSPLAVNHEYNKFDYKDFSRRKQTDEVKEEFKCDYVCAGFSKYEGFARAARFYKEGLVTQDRIYPIGLLTKAQVYQLIKSAGLRLHPMYKFTKGTFDQPSYWKMRSAFLASPMYRDRMLHWFPLLRLDRYRYEVLFKSNKEENGKAK